MRWKSYKLGDVIDWRRKFSWLPVEVHGQVVWLEWVWVRSTLVEDYDGGAWKHEYSWREGRE